MNFFQTSLLLLSVLLPASGCSIQADLLRLDEQGLDIDQASEPALTAGELGLPAWPGIALPWGTLFATMVPRQPVLSSRTATEGIGVSRDSRILMTNRFFIIGAMKAGTTSLYRHLAAHPELFACPQKEPMFYSGERTPAERQEYEELFQDAGGAAWTFEASTSYSRHPFKSGTAERLHSAHPEARLIYLVRDPIERIYSQYIHQLSQQREPLAFGDAVRRNRRYAEFSRYYAQLECYLRHFGRERILVLQFEQFVRNPGAVTQRVFRFLGVDDTFEPPRIGRRHNSSAARFRLRAPLAALRRIAPGLTARLQEALPRSLARTRVPTRQELSDPEAEEFIVRNLQEDVGRLAGLCDLELSLWNPAFQSSVVRAGGSGPDTPRVSSPTVSKA